MNASATRSDFYVYVLFRENGRPFYVGKGQTGRLDAHEQGARRGEIGRRFNIIRAMLARGVEVPKVKLHEGLTEAVALDYEVALIAAIGRADKGAGPLTNVTDGGEGTSGRLPSPQTSARISAALRGKPISPGALVKWTERRHPAETLAKIRAHRHTQEACAKMSAAGRGKPKSPKHARNIGSALRGKPHSPERVAAMAAARWGH
jgi:hypothetical protein